MYLRHFGLRELPFELTPNPKYLFLTPGHREALSNLQYGLLAAKAMTLLVGEAGTGKTTLVRTALESDRCRQVSCVYLNNPRLSRAEFVALVAARIGLPPQAAESKAAFLEELERELVQRRTRGETTALVVDEAQSLDDDMLEEIRLLANIETATEKLLPVVLAGQPEVRDRLNQPTLRQLKQRIALRCEIAPFTVEETAAYIANRIRIAGGEAVKLFTRDAVVLIHERARGIARTINVVCDNALLTAMGLGRRPVDREIVAEVIRDFDLERTSPVKSAENRERSTASAVEADKSSAIVPHPRTAGGVN